MELDAITVLIPLFVISVILVFGLVLSNQMNGSNEVCSMTNNTAAQTACQTAYTGNRANFFLIDKAMILLYVFMIIGAGFSALMVRSHPILYGVVTLAVSVIAWIIVPFISNMFFTLVNNPLVNDQASLLVNTIGFWQNALFYTIIIATLIGVVTHGKPASQQAQWSE